MNIAIIGAGNVGQALGRGWAQAGHRIAYGVRNPEDDKARVLAREQPTARVTTNLEAVRQADVVVLSTPWGATEAAIRACGSLAKKVVIDCTNPLKADFSGLDRGFDTSGAEQVAQWAEGAHVFKAMNQVGFGLMDHPTFASGLKPVMFIAGDGNDKKTVLGLVEDLGFEAVDAGGLIYARLLEPYALLWIHLALSQGQGREFAFALLRK
jgi:8-hydroxy-5-deazaflavin:NADPH oxidoreductase